MSGRKKVYLGVDVGSVSTNFVLLDAGRTASDGVVWKKYLRTNGAPVETLKKGWQPLNRKESGKSRGRHHRQRTGVGRGYAKCRCGEE